MKAIIDGKRYDTDKATFVAEQSNGNDCGNFRFEWECLYRTKNGAWFIAGQGGAFTSYAYHEGNASYGGKAIRPLSPEAALAWLEQHQKTEAIETYFGSQVQDA